jgi:glucose/arabinose dehydrogenase
LEYVCWCNPFRFLRDDALREEYQNDLFVADYNNDYLYDFELSDDRTKLDLEVDLVDKIANDNEALESVALGQGFGAIADIKEGRNGYLYFQGNIYRIVPKLPA